MNKNIKWAAVQPLTGGMYLGTEEAIGHPAEFILSYKGLNNIKYDKDNNPIVVGNEAYLTTYLQKVNRNVPYYVMDKEMFDENINDFNPKITLDGNETEPNYGNLDLVVGVPVCSGLSNVTKAKDNTKEQRNCNMQFLANYVLNKIKPNIYIFENAPGFMGDQASGLRKKFEELAEQTGYSILYYKTDTSLHNNCQKRPRTFIIFSKTDKALKFDWENSHIDTKDYFNQMEKSDYNNEPVKSSIGNPEMMEFLKSKYGNNWRKTVKSDLMGFIMKNNLVDEYLNFIKDHKDYDKIEKYIRHAEYKVSIGKNYYNNSFCLPNDGYFSSVQFRSIPMMLHPIEDRTCTVREFLHLMGMPADFELFGAENNLPKIGQNVPVKTAKFIVKEAIKAFKNNIFNNSKVTYQDNIKQKTFENFEHKA